MATTRSSSEKVKRIFHMFDANRDGFLNREEMTSLVVAVNPRVKFGDDNLNAINDEAFRNYSDFIDGENGITFKGLLRAYEEGAGDVDRDFDTLGLNLKYITPSPSMTNRVREPHKDRWALARWKHGILFDDTWTILDDLDDMVRELKLEEKARYWKVKNNKSSDRFVLDESGQNYATFLKELDVLRSRADGAYLKLEAFDMHMGMGMVLYEYYLFKESLASFSRACELQPTKVIPRFRAGNCLYELGRNKEAKGEFFKALEIAEAGGVQFAHLLPQIHVNLGNVLQVEGMFFNACEHYREAVILCPTHFRALKLLGSSLLALGEYNAAVRVLDEAVYLKTDYLDAHFDLTSALLALGGDQESAFEQLIKVIDSKPDQVDALCSLAEFYLDKGLYIRASQTCDRVLRVWHRLWKAQLREAESLMLGVGRNEEAQNYLKEALKHMVELHDRIAHLKMLMKMRLKGNGSHDTREKEEEEEAYITVELSKFRTFEGKTALRSEMAIALDISGFQKLTRLNQCDVELINNLMNENYVAESSWTEKFLPKPSIENILGKLLGFSKPQSFVGAMKAINEKIFSVLDESRKSGEVDFGLFWAIVAPLCRGTPERRKWVAYNALLLWGGGGNEMSSKIRKSDALRYIKLLRAIYIIPYDDLLNELGELMDTSTSVSFAEFLAMFDDPDWGFGIMFTLLKLETAGDHRNRRGGGRACATCHCQISGLRFKEMKSNLSLCSECYSKGKLPLNSPQQEEYIFKEYNATSNRKRL